MTTRRTTPPWPMKIDGVLSSDIVITGSNYDSTFSSELCDEVDFFLCLLFLWISCLVFFFPVAFFSVLFFPVVFSFCLISFCLVAFEISRSPEFGVGV